MKKNRENSGIIDKFILWGKGVNFLITTAQYYNYIYMYIYSPMQFLGSIQRIARCVCFWMLCNTKIVGY